jgi:hypothetical protein
LPLLYLFVFERSPVVRKFEKSGRRIEFYLGRILGILELPEVGRDRGMMSDEWTRGVISFSTRRWPLQHKEMATSETDSVMNIIFIQQQQFALTVPIRLGVLARCEKV